MPSAVLLEGTINLQRLETTFDLLIKRHEALRTSFELMDGELIQRVKSCLELEFKINFIPLNHDNEFEDKRIKDVLKAFIKPFELSKAPLFRVGIAELCENRHLFIFDAHHIITDGISMTILLNDFSKLYDTGYLPELHIQYKDYTLWQEELLESGIMKKQEKYWLGIFSEGVPILNIPTDYPRPIIQRFDGERVYFEIDYELFQSINMLALETQSTLFMLLLYVYYILLSKYSGQEDIIVASPVTGRTHADLEGVIGMFVNIVICGGHLSENGLHLLSIQYSPVKI